MNCPVMKKYEDMKSKQAQKAEQTEKELYVQTRDQEDQEEVPVKENAQRNAKERVIKFVKMLKITIITTLQEERKPSKKTHQESVIWFLTIFFIDYLLIIN